jgi:hypothetical protein
MSPAPMRPAPIRAAPIRAAPIRPGSMSSIVGGRRRREQLVASYRRHERP